MASASDRILLLGGVGLVKGRIREAGSILVEICDEIDPVLRESGFLKDAPFERLSGIIRFGTQRCSVPEYEPINQKGKTLPFAVEVILKPLRLADRSLVKREFLAVTLEALLDVARKYELPADRLQKLAGTTRKNDDS